MLLRVLILIAFVLPLVDSYVQQRVRSSKFNFNAVQDSWTDYFTQFPHISQQQWEQLDALAEYMTEWNSKVCRRNRIYLRAPLTSIFTNILNR